MSVRKGSSIIAGLSGFDIVEFQAPTSSNNYTWYKKYRNGWVEQGQYGNIQRTEATTLINLPVTMATNKYTVLTSGTTATTYQNLLTTGFNLITTVNQYAGWTVCGMAAS